MEKKKSSTKKTTSINKKTNIVKKTTRKKSKKKAFTLIELLAVIIILGILMIIAVPAVTSYISNSRKSAYVNTDKAVMDGARTKVNAGMGLYNTDTTYYIPASMIKTETGDAKSPYGEFEKAYVVVTYNGTSYDYYWMSVDTARTGVKFAKYDDLDEDDIETDIKIEELLPNIGVCGKSKVVVFDGEGNSSSEEASISSCYNDESKAIVENNGVIQICIIREPFSKDNAEYYSFTGNPTIQDLIDSNKFTIDDGKALYDFRNNQFFTCVANNPYTFVSEGNNEQYYDYLYNCESQNLHMVLYSYDEIAQSSSKGCYLIDYPIL